MWLCSVLMESDFVYPLPDSEVKSVRLLTGAGQR